MKIEFKQDEVILHLPVLPQNDMNDLIEAIERLFADFEQKKEAKELLQKYTIKIQPTTDKAQILKDYKQPNMSKIVGVLPDDEPFEDLIKMI